MNVDDYVRALDVELRDQPRRVRRAEAVGLREHLGELPPGALDELDDPASYAGEYRAQRGLHWLAFHELWSIGAPDFDPPRRPSQVPAQIQMRASVN